MKFSRRWLWWLLLVPMALGLARLRFDVEVLNLLPDKSGTVQGLKLYQQNFANGRELIVTLRSGDAEETESAARALAVALRKETNLVSSVNWQPAWLEYPQQSAELVAYLWLNQPPEIFGQLTNRLAPENLSATLAETKEQLTMSLSPNEIAMRSYDPFGLMQLPESVSSGMPSGSGQELFASSDGKFRLVFVEAAMNLSSYRDCLKWLNQVKAIIAEQKLAGKLPENLLVQYTGRPAFVAEIAGGMEHDMFASVGGTMVIIAILFWFAHRRFRPLIWILVLLALILGGTMALGGLILGKINVISLGFAAILLGLAVDYGLVLYQEAQAAPHLSARQIRHEIAPGILWSAVTTAGAFFILNFSGLPGLAQLGSLVAIGVVLASLVMLFAYLPPLKRAHSILPAKKSASDSAHDLSATTAKVLWGVTILFLCFAPFLLWKKPMRFDYSPDALRPKNSPAYAAIDEIKQAIGTVDEPLWIIASGRDETEIAQRLRQTEAILQRAVSNQQISSFTMPTTLWPQPQNQIANRAALKILVDEKDQLRSAALADGFTSNSFAMTKKLFETWQSALTHTNVFWPTNDASHWIFEKVMTPTTNGFLVVGLVYPEASSAHESILARMRKTANALTPDLEREGVILSGWPLVGASMFDLVEKDLPRVLLPMLALLIFSLWLAFRRIAEVLLSLGALVFNGIILLLVMALTDWSWNLLNLMALPLLLGAGVDYTIHMQLALRRHGGNIREVRRNIGRALWLCGGTTIAGFGSLAFSKNAGLASLGEICAVGIAGAMLTSVYLLPIWWRAFAMKNRDAEKSLADNKLASTGQPSSLYRSGFWKLGLFLARTLPQSISQFFCRAVAMVYWRFNSARREIVIQNLMVPLNGVRAAAAQESKKLFQQFAIKLVDLWRYESGIPIDDLFCELTGWEHFLAAQNQKRGVLVLTPHLGNWEFGAPLLSKRGFKLLVVTLDEPDSRLTEMREAARAKWGIETLVIGKNPFAFVEIIRRLEAGATVALLMDRPPTSSATPVKLFGKTFSASVAAAELARASGCVLLPVYLPRIKNGYAAHILPEISYNRPALRSAEIRRELTQEIMGVFEKPIRQHLDQWYHFIPVWPEKNASKEI